MGYRDTYDRAARDPDAFWMDAARRIEWDRMPDRARQGDDPARPAWFADGMVNGCHNAVDRHVAAGHGDRLAIIHDSPVTGTVSRTTYAELRDAAARLAGLLRARGVEPGDRVVIYMPMVPEALVAMLACARIGAIHSVVFGGFSSAELAKRIDSARPRAILAASCGIEPARLVEYGPLLAGALATASHAPGTVVMLQRAQARADGPWLDWHDAQAGVEPAACVPVRGDHPAYILYTSGTTGAPKGVVRPTGGHLVALDWSMEAVFGLDPGDAMWTASDVGWVVGHSYIVYGPLIRGCTTVLYEGKPVGTPDAGAFWRVMADHAVSVAFTAPTAFRAIRRVDPEGEMAAAHDRPALKRIFLAGERADPATVEWVGRVAGVPVIDNWWQTETGWPIAANPMGLEPQPVKVGSPGVPMPGYDVRVLGEDGAALPPGTLGAVAIRLPLPPGCLPTLWQADDRFRRSYLDTFPGHYETGDAGMLDADGYLWILARTDDVINVAGHRLSTGAMEEAVARHPDVAECAVVGVADPVKGQVPLGLICLTARAAERDGAAVSSEVASLVRERIGPVAAFRDAVVVPRLPKTRSGKTLRATMSAIADGADWSVPPTIDDPAILDEIADALRARGFPRGGTRS